MAAEEQPRVIALHFQQPDFGERHEPAVFAVSDEHPVACAERRPAGCGVLRFESRNLAARQYFGGLLERLCQAVGLNGLEQIIESVLLEGPHGIFAVGGGEDHQRRGIERFQQFEPIAAGQLNVEQQQVRLQLRNEDLRLVRVGGFADHFHFLMALEQAPQLGARQPRILDNQRAQSHCRGMLAMAVTWSRSRLASVSLANSPLSRRSRWRAFSKPNPFPADSTSCPVFSTSISSVPPAIRARIRISPPLGRPEMPCLIAFSTNCCTSMGGTGASLAAGATSTLHRRRSSNCMDSRSRYASTTSSSWASVTRSCRLTSSA